MENGVIVNKLYDEQELNAHTINMQLPGLRLEDGHFQKKFFHHEMTKSSKK